MLRCRTQSIYKVGIALGLLISSSLSYLNGQHVVYMEFKNDFLNYKGDGTDKYFTAGISSGGLIHLKENTSHYLILSLSQKMFTPSNIVLAPEEIPPTDYPYAGLISFNLGYQIFNSSNTAFTKGKFSWGTTGPSSGARIIQRKLHKIIGDREPNGWSTQVQLGNFIQVQLEHTRSIINSTWIKINGVGNIQLGGIFNNLSLSTELKIEKSSDPFINHISKVVHPSDKPRLSLWARPKLAYIFSNLLLETNPNQAGSTLRIMNRIVYYSSVGISLQFNKVSISLIQHNNSPEFRTATKHAFGEIAFQLNI